MNRFGFFDALPLSEAVPTIEGARGLLIPEEKDGILRYLRSGQPLIMIAGIARDLIDPSSPVIGTKHVITDGEWAWTEDVIHYVDKYDLAPPMGFVQRMRHFGWMPPVVSDLTPLVAQFAAIPDSPP